MKIEGPWALKYSQKSHKPKKSWVFTVIFFFKIFGASLLLHALLHWHEPFIKTCGKFRNSVLSIFFLKGAISEILGFKPAKYPTLSSGIFLDLGAHGQTIHQNMCPNETAVCEVSRHSDEHTKLKMSHNVTRCYKHTHTHKPLKLLKLVHTLKRAALPTGLGHVPFSLVDIISEKWQIKPLYKKNAYIYCTLSLGSVWGGEGLLNICRYGCW